jgi:iron complex transport system substrate-binding protein
VGLHLDFLFAGWNHGLRAGTNLTPDYLSRLGIKTLVLTEPRAHVQPGTDSVSIDDTYDDLSNLSKIFGVEKRAAQVIASIQAQLTSVRAEVASLRPITVFDYDDGEAASFMGPGLAMLTAPISLGGGINTFRLPEAELDIGLVEAGRGRLPRSSIIINNYGTPTATQKEKFLETDEITRNLTAVKNRCFLPLSYDEVTPSLRDADAVVAFARWLRPADVRIRGRWLLTAGNSRSVISATR